MAAGFYSNGKAGALFFEGFPGTGEVTTKSANDSVTDSAASGTAIATGEKVNNGVVSMAIPGDGGDIKTILEYFKNMGKSTGLVTTTYITHATPATFGSHTKSRNNLKEIGNDYIYETMPTVMFGGGKGINLDNAEKQGYFAVKDDKSFKLIDSEKASMVIGYFGTDHMPYEYDGNSDDLPHLSEMAKKALEILDNDPDGLFLMVEGGRIDHAGHENNLRRNIHETLEFEKTVKVVYEWAKNNPKTLIIVTADHETGGLKVESTGSKGEYPEVSWSTKGHTGVNVPYYVFGDSSELFKGVLDNTSFYHIITGMFDK